jgi:hypothetical protein
MPKAIPKRKATKMVVCYLDVTADQLRRVLCWVLDPHKVEYSRDNMFNSGDLTDDSLSSRTVMEKCHFFMQSVNEARSSDTIPDLLIWDDYQLSALKGYLKLTELQWVSLFKNTVILQGRCEQIFKYDMRVQGFSLAQISDIMGIEGHEYQKVAKIALRTEQILKKASKELRNAKETNQKDSQENSQKTGRPSRT